MLFTKVAAVLAFATAVIAAPTGGTPEPPAPPPPPPSPPPAPQNGQCASGSSASCCNSGPFGLSLTCVLGIGGCTGAVACCTTNVNQNGIINLSLGSICIPV